MVRHQTSEYSRCSDSLDMSCASFSLDRDSVCLPHFLPPFLLPHCEQLFIIAKSKTLAWVLKPVALEKRKRLSAET